jgi:cyclopropane-fatty-acyl-phospholipid synthase
VTIEVHDKRFFQKVIWYGDIGLGESYFLGYFTTNNLEKLLTWFVNNGEYLPSFPDSKVFAYAIHWGKIFSKILHLRNKNTKS